MAKYNTMFDVAFSIDHDYADPNNIPLRDLIEALEKRLNYLKKNPQEAVDAFGVCDTYDIEDLR